MKYIFHLKHKSVTLDLHTDSDAVARAIADLDTKCVERANGISEKPTTIWISPDFDPEKLFLFGDLSNA